MEKYISTQTKTLNIQLLNEELTAALVVKFWLTPGGYEKAANKRDYIPRTGPFVVSRRKTATGYIEEIAQPGELWMRTEAALTAGEITTINGVITAHDHTKKTAAQALVDANEDAYDVLAERRYSTEMDKAKQNAMLDAMQRFVLFETNRKPSWTG